MVEYIRKNWGIRPLCNCKSDRAPHIGNFCFPLCWRCIAIILGITVSRLLDAYILKFNHVRVCGIALIIIIPCLIDGLLQYKTSYESNNYKRAITGFAAGIGIHLIIRMVTVMVSGI